MKKSRFYYSVPRYSGTVILTPVIDQDGEWAFHIEPTNNKLNPLSRITICGILDTETNVLSFGAAVCSPKDRFEKRIGRELAEKRANDDSLIKVSVTKENISDVFISTATQLERYIMSMKNLKLKGNL